MTAKQGHRAEEPLLPQIAAGDRAAVAECIDRYGALVWAMARRLTPTAEDAEDAVQEIFLDVWRYASRFDAARGPENVFVGILARRKLIDRMRRQKLRLASEEPLETAHEATIAGASRAEHDTELESMHALLAHMTLPQRRVMELSLVQGMSHAEIVEHTGLPLGTVKTLIRRGILNVRAFVAKTDGAAKAAGEEP